MISPLLMAMTLAFQAPPAPEVAGRAEREANPLYLGDVFPWRRRPSAEESLEIIPPEMLRRHEPSSTYMTCRVTADGGFDDCIIHSEANEPRDAAALRAVALTFIDPVLRDGSSAEGFYAEVGMTFDVGGPLDRRDFRIWPWVVGSMLSRDRPGDAVPALLRDQ